MVLFNQTNYLNSVLSRGLLLGEKGRRRGSGMLLGISQERINVTEGHHHIILTATSLGAESTWCAAVINFDFKISFTRILSEDHWNI